MKYKYKTIIINTIKGIKQAERLHQSKEWEQTNVGWESITYKKKENK